MKDKKSTIWILAELNLLLRDGPLPRNYVRRVFKEKGFDYKDLDTGQRHMNLVCEKWNEVEYIRLPKPDEW